MTLFFVRHGETLYNSAGQVTGQRDVPLGPRGRDQAAAVGRALREVFAERGLEAVNVPFVVSPLERARTTAAVARTALGLPPDGFRTDPRLMELSLGAWEGLTMTEVGEKFPADLKARSADPWSVPPTGGETYAQLSQRVSACLADCQRPCVVVAHAGTGRAVVHIEGGVEAHESTRLPILQGRIMVVENSRYAWL